MSRHARKKSDSGSASPGVLAGALSRALNAELRVYLGICAGSGKTRAMLTDALAARARGTDIVVGLAEIGAKGSTSGSLLEKLEILPRARLEYHGVYFEELDVERIVERHPDVTIIDNLAYSNIPGSRHLKRWQDVVELVDRGISVWTAVDVQNLESLSDVVEDICGTHFPEVVPDSVVDMANETVLVETAPESVIERWRLGKVKVPKVILGKEEAFFKPTVLSAFRDLALRYTSRESGAEDRPDRNGVVLPSLGERILVAVGPAPNSAHLVRYARRSAHSLRADWIAVHVESGRKLSDEDHLRLEANLNLARRLGAETMVLRGIDVGFTLLETARAKKVSTIILGRSKRTDGWRRIFNPSVSDRIVRESGKIGVTIVQDRDDTEIKPGIPLIRSLIGRRGQNPPGIYALTALIFIAVTLSGYLLDPWLGYRSVTLIYLAAVLGFSFIANPLAISILAILSALSLNFFFIPPLFTFTIGSPEDWILFGIYFLVSFVTGHLVSRLGAEERILAERERKSEFLYSAASSLAECSSAVEAADIAADILDRHFGLEALVCIGTEGGEPEARFHTGTGAHHEKPVADNPGYEPSRELNAIRYAFAGATVCGRGTGNFPACTYRYLPAVAGGVVLGVIGILLPEGRIWSGSDDDLVISLGHTLALTLGRSASEARSRRISLELESDRLGRILLDSVSHELRTPLTTIMGSISALGDDGLAENAGARRDLLAGAMGAAENLDRIVGDLLSISRIESGMLSLNREMQDMEELASSCIEGAGEILRTRETRLSVNGSGAPEIDAVLVAKLGANLLRNAAAYSPAGTPIELTLAASDGDFVLSVRDHGPGMTPAAMKDLYGKFRRGPKAPGKGLGLGLAICKGIADAHGGTIDVRNAHGGGLEVVVTFPDCVKEG